MVPWRFSCSSLRTGQVDTQHSSAEKSVTCWGWKRAEEVKRLVGSAPSRTSQCFQLFRSAALSLGGHPLHSQPSSSQWPPRVGEAGQLAAPPSAPAPPLLHPPPGARILPETLLVGLTSVRAQARPRDTSKGGAPGKGSRPSP